MNGSLAAKSLWLFGVSILFLILLTLFESALVGLSAPIERLISALFLILPGILGIVCGILSLQRKEGKTIQAVAGIVLNTLFALFQSFVLSFAG